MRLPTSLGLIGLTLVFPMRCWVQEKAPDWQGKTAFAQKTLGFPDQGQSKREFVKAYIEGFWHSRKTGQAATHAVIVCWKAIETCAESSGTTTKIKETPVTVSVSEYSIVAWDDAHIVAIDDSPICISNQITIRFDSREANTAHVFEISTPKNPGLAKAEKVCEGLDLKEPVTYTLTF